MDKKRNIRTSVRGAWWVGEERHCKLKPCQIVKRTNKHNHLGPVVTIYGYNLVPLLCGPEPVALPLCANKNKDTTSLLSGLEEQIR